MFGWLFSRRSRREQRGPEGVCPGCSHPIDGTLTSATWRPLPGVGLPSDGGTLYAYHCPNCGVPLLAWDPSGGTTADGRRLRWHMHAARTPRGQTISERQVTVWSNPEERMSAPPRRRMEVEDVDGVSVVRFLDRRVLDEPYIPFREELFQLADESGRRNLLLDLGNVEFWSSAALGVFIRLHRQLGAVGGKLVFWNVAEDMREVLRLTRLDTVLTVVAHPELADRRAVIGEVFGDPSAAFDPAWRTETVVSLARRMYDTGDFDLMPVMSDALQDAGCEDAAILDHCRGRGPHVRGCWVADLVLGRQ
jgi:anti-anti-sigma factor